MFIALREFKFKGKIVPRGSVFPVSDVSPQRLQNLQYTRYVMWSVKPESKNDIKKETRKTTKHRGVAQ